MTEAPRQVVPANPFDVPEEALRARRNVKWSLYAPDVLPAFIAEMDCSPAEAVAAAVRRIAEDGDYGYPWREGRSPEQALAAAFADRMAARFGWEPDPAHAVAVADLVQAFFAAIVAFSEPGEGIALLMPSYPPFRDAIAATGRTTVAVPLTDRNGYRFAADDLGRLIPPRTRLLVVCNPHNPTGRMFERAELEALAGIAAERDLVVLADEVHADLAYDGRRHIPLATLGAEAAARTMTITSATKSFNIPGLRCGVVHFGSAGLRQRFLKQVPARLLGLGNSFGIDATIAAWRDGQSWLDGVVAHLQAARDRVAAVLAAEAPMIRWRPPEATFLAWLDCSALRLPVPAFIYFHDEARIAFSAGESFDPDGAAFVRFNFATSRTILDQILDRFVDAARAAVGA